MATAVDAPRAASAAAHAKPRWLLPVAAWHALLVPLSIAAVAGAFRLGEVPAAVRVLAVAAAIAGTVANVAAVPLLLRLDDRGRTIALVVDYLLCVACLALLLQVTGVFQGIDALGGTFGRGLPFLALALVGFGVTALGDRDAPQRPARRIGLALLALAAAGWLLAVGLLPGLATFATRLAAPRPALLLAGGVLAGAAARFLWGREGTAVFGVTRERSETLNGFLLLSPNLLGFLLFFAGPLAFSLYVSFNEWDAFGSREFIGLGNYAAILRDRVFWGAARNILIVAVVGIPLAVAPALVLATLLNSKVPGVRIFRALYFIPAVAGVVGVTLIWKQLFNSTVGYLNYAINRVVAAVNVLPGVELADPQVGWLSDASVALYSIIIVFAWQTIGLNTVYFLAGLQGIPEDLYEAAHLDGANGWQRFRNITIPMLAPTTFFVVATTGILALQLFAEPFVLFSNSTPPGFGPGASAVTPVSYLYDQGFRRFAQGYASAVAWTLFAFIFLFTFAQFRRQRAQADAFGGE